MLHKGWPSTFAVSCVVLSRTGTAGCRDWWAWTFGTRVQEVQGRGTGVSRTSPIGRCCQTAQHGMGRSRARLQTKTGGAGRTLWFRASVTTESRPSSITFRQVIAVDRWHEACQSYPRDLPIPESGAYMGASGNHWHCIQAIKQANRRAHHTCICRCARSTHHTIKTHFLALCISDTPILGIQGHS